MLRVSLARAARVRAGPLATSHRSARLLATVGAPAPPPPPRRGEAPGALPAPVEQEIRSTFELVEHVLQARKEFGSISLKPTAAIALTARLLEATPECTLEDARGDPVVPLPPHAETMAALSAAIYSTSAGAFQRQVEAAGIPASSIAFQQLSADGLVPAHAILVCERLQAVVVCVRGTASLPDLVTDLAGAATPFAGASCHTGIAACSNSFFTAEYSARVNAELAKAGRIEAISPPSALASAPVTAPFGEAFRQHFPPWLGGDDLIEPTVDIPDPMEPPSLRRASASPPQQAALPPQPPDEAVPPAAVGSAGRKKAVLCAFTPPVRHQEKEGVGAAYRGIGDVLWRLHKRHPTYSVVFTGHSLGAAVAGCLTLKTRALLHRRHLQEMTIHGSTTASAAAAVASHISDLQAMCACEVPVYGLTIAPPPAVSRELAAVGSLTPYEARALVAAAAPTGDADAAGGGSSSGAGAQPLPAAELLAGPPQQRYRDLFPPARHRDCYPRNVPILQAIVHGDDVVPRASIASLRALHDGLVDDAEIQRASKVIVDSLVGAAAITAAQVSSIATTHAEAVQQLVVNAAQPPVAAAQAVFVSAHSVVTGAVASAQGAVVSATQQVKGRAEGVQSSVQATAAAVQSKVQSTVGGLLSSTRAKLSTPAASVINAVRASSAGRFAKLAEPLSDGVSLRAAREKVGGTAQKLVPTPLATLQARVKATLDAVPAHMSAGKHPFSFALKLSAGASSGSGSLPWHPVPLEKLALPPRVSALQAKLAATVADLQRPIIDASDQVTAVVNATLADAASLTQQLQHEYAQAFVQSILQRPPQAAAVGVAANGIKAVGTVNAASPSLTASATAAGDEGDASAVLHDRHEQGADTTAAAVAAAGRAASVAAGDPIAADTATADASDAAVAPASPLSRALLSYADACHHCSVASGQAIVIPGALFHLARAGAVSPPVSATAAGSGSDASEAAADDYRVHLVPPSRLADIRISRTMVLDHLKHAYIAAMARAPPVAPAPMA